jgi:hypothetical protein
MLKLWVKLLKISTNHHSFTHDIPPISYLATVRLSSSSNFCCTSSKVTAPKLSRSAYGAFVDESTEKIVKKRPDFRMEN